MVDPDTGDVVDHAVECGAPSRRTTASWSCWTTTSSLPYEPEPSRDIEVTRFLDPRRSPTSGTTARTSSGPTATTRLLRAGRRAGDAGTKEGVARWVMRKKAYVGALRVHGDHLMLITLRNAGEVVPASALKRPAGRTLDPRELEMAKQLVAAWRTTWTSRSSATSTATACSSWSRRRPRGRW
jgi:DNA end-binding protein Ku